MSAWAIPTIALVLLAFAAVSKRLSGTPITAPIVFLTAGLFFGAGALGIVDVDAAGEAVKLLAEITLGLVLFSDAASVDMRALRKELSETEVHRLALAIRSATGIEALIWLTDVAGLTRSEATKLMRWSAQGLLRSALTDPPRKPVRRRR